jgi:hypothetical protein
MKEIENSRKAEQKVRKREKTKKTKRKEKLNGERERETNKKWVRNEKSANNISLAGPFQPFHSPSTSTMESFY